MALITIPKKELDDLTKLCKEQEAKLKEQDALLKKVQFSATVTEGENVYLLRLYYALALQQANLVAGIIATTKIPENLTDEEKEAREKTSLTLKSNLPGLSKLQGDAANAWAKFCKMYPEPSKNILSRLEAAGVTGVS